MLLAILFGLQVLGNILVCVESIDERGLKDVSSNEMDIDKRIDQNKISKLINMYNSGSMIPDSRCSLPFSIYRRHIGFIDMLESDNNYCKNDGGTDVWCSRETTYIRGRGRYFMCLMKGEEVADTTKWKPPQGCVPIFAYYNPKYKKYMYYKGCTNIDEEKPWCAHDVRYESGRWSFCIDIEKKWTEWSSWSQCSQTCNGGSMTRARRCQQTGQPSSGCPGGNSAEEKSCNSEPCPINGGWSEWTSYSDCSETCGNGIKTKTRECNNPEPKNGGQDCGGVNKYNDPCKVAECSQWLSWNKFTKCSVECGGGKRSRTRACDSDNCIGSSNEEIECNTAPCASVAPKFSKMTKKSKSWIIILISVIGTFSVIGIVAATVIWYLKKKQRGVNFVTLYE